jgi:SNF2 family DNA or RNA helicase
MHKFFPHQERALAYAKDRSRIFLAMEMRTGKTPVTIRWATLRGLRKILVVAPLTTINPGWVEELEREGIPAKRIHILTEMPKRDRMRTVKKKRGWHLINYEYVRANPEILEQLHSDKDGIVLDESTRIRSPKAQITKAMQRYCDVEHRALLSGMPNPESVGNWFEQMRFMNGDLLGYTNYWHFRQSLFKQPWPGSYEWVPKAGAMERIKTEVHRHVFTLTAKQAGMFTKHVYEKRMVDQNRIQKQLTRQIVRDFQYGDVETKWAPVQQMWLARLAGGFSPDGKELVSNAKLKELLSIVKEELPPKSQVVVWARFRSEIYGIRDYLRSKKIKVAVMTGSTDRVKRRLRIKRFRKGDYQVIVVQARLGMYGLNLATADTDVYYSNMWENEVRTQCEKRIEHLTKKTPLLHIDLITRDSVDEEVVPRLREKKMNARAFNLVLKGMQDRWRRIYPRD